MVVKGVAEAVPSIPGKDGQQEIPTKEKGNNIDQGQPLKLEEGTVLRVKDTIQNAAFVLILLLQRTPTSTWRSRRPRSRLAGTTIA